MIDDVPLQNGHGRRKKRLCAGLSAAAHGKLQEIVEYLGSNKVSVLHIAINNLHRALIYPSAPGRTIAGRRRRRVAAAQARG